ncbi:glycosyltransferase family 2 protein [Aulographum hederae CBS 113979]|uniref:dolichyl-phosphate beta-glucosyltransferase n=1 Tax=Aulographum hederae CBS 113979 TaxID=1176131 RepID=A0A6G1HD55_9PEZI|nr:glycosyltransferase family 2 protein [Aulographum hederae CBS 113979]
MGHNQGAGAVAARILHLARKAPPSLILLALVLFIVSSATLVYVAVFIVAPDPRPPRRPEKTYVTILPDGNVSESKQLPCWQDQWRAKKELARRQRKEDSAVDTIDEGEIFMSVVVPAYNEERRLGGMLEEAVDFLQKAYGDAHGAEIQSRTPSIAAGKSNGGTPHHNGSVNPSPAKAMAGWEILVVSDGSTDKTVDTALQFARDHQLLQYPVPVPGPRTPKPTKSTNIPHGSIRVINLEENRGKGGAVTHGMRHVRGKYAVFADADGASRFEDLEGLVKACQECEDDQGRAVGIGSRAHLVGSEAVVKRSQLRNFLMHSFHLLLRFMTPPATAAIKDTQCGFKLFSRASLPYIIPYMHAESWIFDVEMLMLAESADIPMVEVAVGWKEVAGSKLNVIWDSLGMAWGLAILRAAWAFGVYRRT